VASLRASATGASTRIGKIAATRATARRLIATTRTVPSHPA
jgi:hypothetical protein